MQNSQQRAKQIIENCKIKNYALYDKKSNNIKLKIGDLIYVDRPTGHKLSSKFSGPYKIVSLDDNKNCTVTDNTKTWMVHMDRIRKDS